MVNKNGDKNGDKMEPWYTTAKEWLFKLYYRKPITFFCLYFFIYYVQLADIWYIISF